VIPRNVQITLALVLVAVVATAIYGVQLKRRDERNRQHSQAMVAVSGEVEPTKFRAAIAFDEDGIITEQELAAPLPQEATSRAKEMLRTVLHEYMKSPSPHEVPQGSDIRAVYLTSDGLCVINVNRTLADKHRSGMLLEQFTLLSLMETLTMNMPSVRQVKVLVDGKERASLAGHADLSLLYGADAVHAAAKEYAHR
jgi:hypothetical protein